MDYDVAVLGGGPGGYVCAIRMSQNGFKTILIEEGEVGGTCLNRGCIPTKALLHTSKVYSEASKAEQFGVIIPGVGLDYKKAAAHKDKVVQNLRRGVEGLLKSHGVTVEKARGKLISNTKISLSNGKSIEAETIVLATGTVPAQPPIPGVDIEGVIDSDGALALTERPDSVIIIGGGVIGIEFATLFAELGSQVTVIEMLDEILNSIDDEIRRYAMKDVKAKGIQFLLGARVQSIEPGVKVHVLDKKEKQVTVEAQLCIVASGRRPLTQEIGLEQAGVDVNSRGYVGTDGFMRSSCPNIFAIGDITGRLQLAHAASAQGLLLADYLAGKNRRPILDDRIPSCIYTHPEIAMVGKTERELKEMDRPYKVGSFALAGNGKAMTMGNNSGLIKLLADEKTGEILGAHMVGPGVTDMIAEVVAVMEAEGTIDELANAIHPHPTICEAIMESAQDLEGHSVHKMSKKK